MIPKIKLRISLQENVIQGAGDYCTTVRNFLCAGFTTGRTDKAAFESNAGIKEKQAAALEEFCKENNLWLEHLPHEDQYLTRGGESKIYLHADQRSVIKINEGVYYATWLDFFNSILLHNLFFSNTAYTFLGLIKINNAVHAVLRQPFVNSDAQAELEDMHDENVIVNSDTLFFIDSVFYLIEPDTIE